MDIADRDRERVDAALALEALGLPRRRDARWRAIDVPDDADFALDGDAGAARCFNDARGERDVVVKRQPGAVDHHRGEARIDPLAALLKRRRVIDVADDRNVGAIRQRAENLAEYRRRRVAPTARAGLQDDWDTRLLGGLYISARVLPAMHNKTSNSASLRDGLVEDLTERRCRHLNFAIMSLMPGIVSIWWA